jgi:hypothetical protein
MLVSVVASEATRRAMKFGFVVEVEVLLLVKEDACGIAGIAVPPLVLLQMLLLLASVLFERCTGIGIDIVLLEVLVVLASLPLRGAQLAKAAKCNGKHPCRDSRCPAASGYNRINTNKNRHTRTNGSFVGSSVGHDPALRNLKHA